MKPSKRASPKPKRVEAEASLPALGQLEEHFRAVIEQAPVSVQLFSPDGDCVYANPAWETLWGTKREQLVGYNILADPQLAAKGVLPYIQQAFAGEPAFIPPVYYDPVEIGQVGVPRWTQAWIYPLKDTAGRMLAVALTHEDITAHQEAEAATLKSEKYFKALIQNSADIIQLVNSDGLIRYISPSVTRVLGYTPEELVGRPVPELLHPDELEWLQQSFSGLLQRPGGTESLEQRVRHKDGSWRWIAVIASNLLYDPAVQAMVVNYRDITDQKRVGATLRQSEARFRALIENSSDAIALANDAGVIQYASPATARLLGYTAEEFVGLPGLSLLHPDDLEGATNTLIRVIQQPGQVVQAAYRIRHKDGTWRWISGTLQNLLAEPDVGAIIINYRDITERKWAEEAQQQNAAEIAALYRASAPLVRPESNLTDLAEQMAQAVTQEFALADCGVMLINEAGDELKRIARAGSYRVETSVPLPLAGRGLTASAARTGQVIYAPDVTTRPEYLSGVAQTRSELVIPLKAGDRVIGVLDLQSPEPDAFDERSQRIVAAFAERAALALENARLLEQTRQRSAELEALARFSVVLRTSQTRAEMLHAILNQVLGLFQAEGTMLTMRHPATGDLLVEVGQGAWANATSQHFPPGAGLTEHVITSGQPYVNQDVRSEARLDPALAHLPLQTVAAVPLIAHEHPLGVLWMGRSKPMSDSDVRLLTALGDIAANAIHRATLHEQTQQRLQRLAALRQIDVSITGSLDLRLTLNFLLEQVTNQLHVDAASVLLLNPHLHLLEYTAGRGFHSQIIARTRLRLGEGYAGRAVLERQPIRLPNLADEETDFAREQLLTQENFHAYYGMPLISKGQVVGVLEIFHRTPLPVDVEWLDFLEALAGQAAIAIDNAQLFTQLQQTNSQLVLAYDATIEGWSRALDLRDKETEGHSQRVTEMTLALTQTLGSFHDSDLVHLRRGALLHDIGKMGIPDAILLKPGQLTNDEWVIMRRHPEYAYELLSPITHLRPALDIPYCHHEKWDGTGYPRGLKGEQIPLAARLFAVVDVWDALRSDRPYRAGWPEDKVLDHIRSLTGAHFDPVVAEVFLEMRQVRTEN